MKVLSKKKVNLARSNNRPATASVYAFEQEEEDEVEVRNFQKINLLLFFSWRNLMLKPLLKKTRHYWV